MLIGKSKCFLRELIFTRQSGAEQRWIVGVERDHHALVEIVPRGMFRYRRAHSGAEIAGDTQFHGNLALCEFFDQVWVLGGTEAVTNAFGAQVERSPNRFRRSGLSSVRGQA